MALTPINETHLRMKAQSDQAVAVMFLELDATRAALAQAERERDEARKALEGWPILRLSLAEARNLPLALTASQASERALREEVQAGYHNVDWNRVAAALAHASGDYAALRALLTDVGLEAWTGGSEDGLAVGEGDTPACGYVARREEGVAAIVARLLPPAEARDGGARP